MYRKILVALENSPSDKALLAHVSALAKAFRSTLVIVHVADGWVARHYDDLNLVESDEMRADRTYLEEVVQQLASEGLEAQHYLALGNPPVEIQKAAEKHGCDLIAMASHGHRWLGDLVHGSTIEPVRHHSKVPMLIVPGVLE